MGTGIGDTSLRLAVPSEFRGTEKWVSLNHVLNNLHGLRSGTPAAEQPA